MRPHLTVEDDITKHSVTSEQWHGAETEQVAGEVARNPAERRHWRCCCGAGCCCWCCCCGGCHCWAKQELLSSNQQRLRLGYDLLLDGSLSSDYDLSLLSCLTSCLLAQIILSPDQVWVNPGISFILSKHHVLSWFGQCWGHENTAHQENSNKENSKKLNI